jgi:hypothetical protein
MLTRHGLADTNNDTCDCVEQSRSNEFPDEIFCCREASTALLADDLHRGYEIELDQGLQK